MTNAGANAGARPLGLLAATALIVGEVIGIGIFLTPAEMTGTLAAPGLVYAMWLVAGVMAATGALCFGELASRFPETGGAYVYLRKAWGDTVAFLYGWKCMLVLDPGLTAAWAFGLAEYVAYLTPLGLAGRKALACGMILALAVLTARGTRLAAGALVGVTALKLLALAALVVFGFASDALQYERLLPVFERAPGAPPLMAALGTGFVSAFFTLGGWWDAARMAGEVRNPQRTLPLAFVIGISTVAVVYVLMSAVFLGLVPISEAAGATAVAARVGELLFGPAGGAVLAVVVVLCVLGSLASYVLSAPRVYVAMAQQGLFPKRFARPHARWGTPVGAIAVQTTLSVLLVATGNFGDALAYFIFVTVAFVALSVAALFRLPPASGAGYRTPGGRFTAGVFVTLSMALLALIAQGRPVHAALGVLVVALGVPARALFTRLAGTKR